MYCGSGSIPKVRNLETYISLDCIRRPIRHTMITKGLTLKHACTCCDHAMRHDCMRMRACRESMLACCSPTNPAQTASQGASWRDTQAILDFHFMEIKARELENWSLDLQARFCKLLTTEIIEKTRPFREIPVRWKGKGQNGGGIKEKLFGKVGWEPYSLRQYHLWQHNALLFMIAKFRAGKLHWCLQHSSTDRALLWGDFEL